MQILPSERPMPAPLTCSGCRHWAHVASTTLSDTELAGCAGRFAETRPGAARLRCNICWEPAVAIQPIQTGTLADNGVVEQ
ncbi:MAG: hypothetical protein ACR2M3_02830, partial [Thermomicrobiales bacterium]